MSDNSSSGGDWGCLPFIVFILVFWALCFGLGTPCGKYNIDIFPPKIWLMDEDGNEIVR